MEIDSLKACRICGNTDLVPIVDLGVHALSGRFPAKDEADPPIAPLALVKCNVANGSDYCGLLQLQHSVPGDELYCHNYGYRSGINQTMRNHLEGIVREVETRVPLKEGDTVLDIGSNDATLLKFHSTPGIKRIGIDPTGKQFEKYYPEGIALLSDFFTAENFEKISPKDKAKVITSIAMVYDLPDPCGFVRDIKSALAPDGVWVFEQSYMPTMLDTNSFDTICHEHLEYYGLKQVMHMLDRAGMKALDVSFSDINGGSFRVTATHKESRMESKDSRLIEVLQAEKARGLDTAKPYEEFQDRVSDVKKQFTDFVSSERAKGKSFYIYGASTKGNTLLQYFGVDASSIVAAAERNPEKYGRRTPMTSIPIISEEEARAAKPDYFVVLPWHFRDEFLKRERSYLEQGGKLIFPLPKFEVIGKEDAL
jgi:trans-aconitate methyltransferase